MSLGGQPGSPRDLERHGGGEGTTQGSGFRATVSGGGSLSVCVEEGAGSPPLPPGWWAGLGCRRSSIARSHC